jgi:hypothetical protein
MNYHSRQIIISPLVYLMEERRGLLSWTVFTKPRTIVSGWILGLLPHELHQEAARRVKDPLVEKIEGILHRGSCDKIIPSECPR